MGPLLYSLERLQKKLSEPFKTIIRSNIEVMKQVIVADESLKLPRGKLAAQIAHAAVASFLTAGKKHQQKWVEEGMPKVVLSAENEKEVVEYYEKALAVGLPAQLIRDAGRTVIPEGTITCVGIGPAPENDIDKITGHLKLIK